MVSIDGCIIGQEQNSNKKALAFTQIHSLEIRIENQKGYNSFAPQYYSTYAIRASYFLTHLRRGVSGATLKFCSPKTAA